MTSSALCRAIPSDLATSIKMIFLTSQKLVATFSKLLWSLQSECAFGASLGTKLDELCVVVFRLVRAKSNNWIESSLL